MVAPTHVALLVPDLRVATTPDVVAGAIVGGLDRGAHTVYAPGLVRWVMLLLRALPRALFRRIPA